DVRADVFALGCVLFECLTGRPAFLGQHVMALLAKMLIEVPPRVDALRPEVPAALADLVARMLSKAREDRPADAAALVAEIDQLGARDGAPGPSVPRRAEALTGSEQQLLCVIIATEPGRDASRRTSVEALRDETLAATGKPLEKALAPFGARISALGL